MATRHIECPVAISRDSLLQDTLLRTFYFIKIKEKNKRLQNVFISMMCCVLGLGVAFFCIYIKNERVCLFYVRYIYSTAYNKYI